MSKSVVFKLMLELSVIVMLLEMGMLVKQRKMLKKTKKSFAVIEECLTDVTNDVFTKYDFIDKNIAVYIEQLSSSMELDSDLVMAILMKENPSYDVNATNVNSNGTVDVGLFQLNDFYLWYDFKDRYWKFDDVELNPLNWKHNCYIALHHIKWLEKNLKVQDDVIMAYNCGLNAVLNDRIPSSTKSYLISVNNNMRLLKKL